MNIKIIISLLLAVSICLFIYNGYSQESKESTVKTVEIKTSAQCNNCKINIEKAVNKLPGIKEANVNLETKILKVKFNATKINTDEIRKTVANAGYEADSVKAVKK